jgi:hypothetical protein
MSSILEFICEIRFQVIECFVGREYEGHLSMQGTDNVLDLGGHNQVIECAAMKGRQALERSRHCLHRKFKEIFDLTQ